MAKTVDLNDRMAKTVDLGQTALSGALSLVWNFCSDRSVSISNIYAVASSNLHNESLF